MYVVVNASINPVCCYQKFLGAHWQACDIYYKAAAYFNHAKRRKKHLKTERETWLSPKRGARAERNFTALMISIFCKDRSRKNVKHLSYLHRSMTRDSPSVWSPFQLQ